MLRGRNLFLTAFILSSGAIAYFDMKKCHRLPWPPRFIYTAMAFFFLDLISFFSEELSGVSAIGFVIAIFLKEGWVASCPPEIAGTGQPQTTAFIAGSYQSQPASAQVLTTGNAVIEGVTPPPSSSPGSTGGTLV